LKYTILVDGKREPNPKLGSMPLSSMDTIAWKDLFVEMGFYKSGVGIDNTWEHTKDSELLVHFQSNWKRVKFDLLHFRSDLGQRTKCFYLDQTRSASEGIETLLTEIRNIHLN
jgi:hypothetical protein